MSTKIQGEGDYEAARRFNQSEQDFVKRKLGLKAADKKNDVRLDVGEETLDREVLEYLRSQGIELPDRRD